MDRVEEEQLVAALVEFRAGDKHRAACRCFCDIWLALCTAF
jgi:hypothetical protein